MKHFMNILLSIVAMALFSACGISTDYAEYEEPAEYVLDKIIANGNRYDVASFLLDHKDFLDETSGSFCEGELINYETSPDGLFRVYSMQDPCQSYPNFANIVQYSHPLGVALRLEAMRDMGRIESVGMVRAGLKTYYLAVTKDSSFVQGSSSYTYAIRAFALTNYTDELIKADLFMTKSGKRLNTIKVSWDDDGGQFSDWEEDFEGVSLETEPIGGTTTEVCVQVITPGGGIPTDDEICYTWNGWCFKYNGIRNRTTNKMIRK